MDTRKAFTLIELLTVMAIIGLLIAILMPALQRAREQGQRVVCLSNLKDLTLAWIMYADENDSKIVNGMGGIDRPKEKAWVGQCWASDYGAGGQLLEAEQLRAIGEGSLFPYCKNEKLYRCPTGYRGEMLTYAVMDSMNGMSREGTEKKGVWIQNRMDIPHPSERAVFIDEGWVTPDSFAVHYTQETWWDDPPVRHGDGTNLSFADGHEEYWKWKGSDTIKMGKEREHGHPGNHYSPVIPQSFQDLYRTQKTTWGGLGYTPSQ